MESVKKMPNTEVIHATGKNGAGCDGSCGGVFVCPTCGRLCGWCFGGAPDERCDDCSVADRPILPTTNRGTPITREGVRKFIDVCRQISEGDEVTAEEAEAELRGIGIDVNGFVERLKERITRARLLQVSNRFMVR
jgi:hypothetical protein